MNGRNDRRDLLTIQLICAAAAVAGFTTVLWAGLAAHGPLSSVLPWAAGAALLSALAVSSLAMLVVAIRAATRNHDHE
jgi:hypothetical protein